jgi:hypothetical protein
MLKRHCRAVALIAILATSACGTRVGTGSGPASSSPGHGPMVVATVIGQKPMSKAGANPVAVTVRSGADVVLSGKDSDGTDAAIVSFSWQQTGGPALPAAPDLGALLYRTANTVSFKAPLVAPGAAPLTFRLTVTDAHGVTGTADVSVTVVPPGDQDRTLLRPELAHKFTVVALTGDGLGGSQLTADAPVCIQMLRTITYQTRSGTTSSVTLPAVQFDTAWKSGTKVVSAAADGSAADAAAQSSSNPRVTFDLPSFNDDDIFARYNQPGSTNNLDLQLVPGDVDSGQLQVSLNATAGTCAAAGSGAAAASPLILAVLGSDGHVKLKSAAAQGAATLNKDAGSATLTSDSLLMATAATQTKTVGGNQVTFTSNPVETAASADAYYAAIDPTASKTTLTEWLTANCFDPTASDYGVSKAGAGNGAHAVYTNNFDLGFGRDMYFIRCTADHTDSAGHVTAHAGDMASVVVNYPSLEQTALKQATIIAVAMEWSASADGTVPNRRFAKFYVFAPDDRTGEFTRVRSANFDRRGQKYVPGSCTSCHSGTPPSLPVAFTGPTAGSSCTASSYNVNSCYPLLQDPLVAAQGQPATPTCAPGSPPGTAGCLPPGDVDAAFLPWDADSFLYSDTDPAFSGHLVPAAPYVRSAQEPALKALNQLAHSTYKYGIDQNGADIVESVMPAGGTKPVDRYLAAKTLTEFWYGGPTFPNPTYADYTDANPPEGWTDQPAPLYHTVFARNCRTCHTVDADPREQFSGLNKAGLAANQLPDGYQKLLQEFSTTNGQPGKGQTYLYQQVLMPLARLTMDRFWVDFEGGKSAADTLATALQQQPNLSGQPAISARLQPANTELTLSAPAVANNSSDARIDATDSDFLATAKWTLGLSPLQNFTTNPSSPDCTAGSGNTAVPLVGDNGPTPGFFITKSGLYRATLTPDNGVGQTGPAASYEYDVCVPNFQPGWAPSASTSCNATPAAPYQSTGPGAVKSLGLLACFSGLGNAPYTVGVSGDGTNFGPTASGPSSTWAASVTCNGLASGGPCNSPDVQFNFNANASSSTPVPVYFKLCDVDGDCTPSSGANAATLSVTPTSLKIQNATVVMYWAPCLNPQQFDPSGSVARCPATPLTNTFSTFPAGSVAIQSAQPRTTPPFASLNVLNSTLILGGAPANTPLALTFDATFGGFLAPSSVSGTPVSLPAAVAGIGYTPPSEFKNNTLQGPFVTSDINGRDLATGAVAPALTSFTYTLTAGPQPPTQTFNCNSSFSAGASSCSQSTVEIRALSSFDRAAGGQPQSVFAILTATCATGGCHDDAGAATPNSWKVVNSSTTPDALGTYNSICNSTSPASTASTSCATPATATVPAMSPPQNIVIPGDPDRSLFYTAACLGKGNAGMPNQFPPTDARCQIIYQWILEGAAND